MKRVYDEDVEGDIHGHVLYEGKPFTGEVVEVTPDGTMISLVTYTDGAEDGPWLEWYPDGKPRVEGRTERGKGAVGMWQHWHPNGQIAEENSFDEEGRQIRRRRWDADGKILEDGPNK